ncbi:hypothetical protein GCM10008904_21250 [Paraclostridium ghonii]|uniref:Acyl transferase domain-containing protein/acyl carrier protein n=1 Tax=Paraclostridium ghonii TaxID=29358 RepID=A0ABU0N024_9FIRM|nr:type I polyketide synthase [Paeniclostridium ghonii]MDQ0556517.1 acyl transferase domain-containing protein/acyl carrier protein [Paeniclostridium ghonii]
MSSKTLTLNDLLRDNTKDAKNRDIAIIGVSCNSALGNNISEMWQSILDKVDCIRDFPANRIKDLECYLGLNDKSNVKYLNGGYLEKIDEFDNDYFKITPIEAKLMSPNQRLFLRCAVETIQDAGYDGMRVRGSKTGVFTGYVGDLGGEGYRTLAYMDKNFDSRISIPANLPSMIPSRIAYLLDLKGPTMLVDTACSSSLVAVHLACNSILQGECDMAIAGGVRINIIPIDKKEEKLGVESSDDITRTFDNFADGSGMGEGVGAILLKSLDKAIKDNDNIYAVVKGSAINQDGYGIGITAPNKESQINVLSNAWDCAKINPESLSYIECHGTATNLGDLIEIDAITEAMKRYTNKKSFCAVGSVKTNIGHSYQAAGIMGMIKTILALKNKTIPPTINFSSPNKKIDFEDSPIYVNTKARHWESNGKVRRAGVSAFGLSGTNCHLILEEFIEPDKNLKSEEEPLIFTFSAMEKEVLEALIQSYSSFINQYNKAIKNISYTLNTGREHYNNRIAIVAKNREELLEKINYLIKMKENGDLIYMNSFKVVSKENLGYRKDSISTEDIDNFSSYANRLIENIRMNRNNHQLLGKLCELYVNGANVEWERLYDNKEIQKVSMPMYPFKKSRLWVEYKTDAHFYNLKWKEDKTEYVKKEKSDGTIILFTDTYLNEFNSIVKSKYSNVIEVCFGEKFRKIDEFHYEVSEEDDYHKLISSIESKNINKIININTFEFNQINSEERLIESQKRSVYSLLYLVKALSKNYVSSNFEIIIITNSSISVTSEEKILNPHNSTILGLGKVVSKEHPEFKCKCIDLDDFRALGEVLDDLDNFDIKFRQLAYRNGKRYVEEFIEVDEKDSKTPIEIRENGVYVITGATGGMGKEIAKALSSNRKINIILISRTKLPERCDWDYILQKHIDDDIAKFINHIKQLESRHTTVEYYDADVTDFSRMNEVMEDVKEKYGNVNGIIHSAGIPGKGMIINKEIAEFEKVLWTKVKGTWILDKLTEEQNLDFFILFSSVASIFGEIGQGDYAAANSYLDAYAAHRNRSKKNTISINWVVWKDTGMGIAFGLNEKDLLFNPIKTEDAITWFKEILKLNTQNVLAGEMNKKSKSISELINDDFVLSNSILLEIKDHVEIKHNNQRCKSVDLIGYKESNYTEIEKEIGDICGNLLGYSTIDIYDNFFELGADSIQIKRIHEAIDKVYSGIITVADMFAYTSISSLSKYIEQKLQKEINQVQENDSPIQGILSNFKEGKINLDEVIMNLKDF